MFRIFQMDETDPVVRSYRRYFYKLATHGVLLLVLTSVTCLIGIPHIQTTYTYMGSKPASGIPRTEQKLNAWYFSVTGWQHVQSGQYGHHGCPVILLIPVEDCIDFRKAETVFPFTLFFKD